MKTFDEVYVFLKSMYLHSRFEGRNESTGWAGNYSALVTKSVMDDLKSTGESCISHFDSRTGQIVKFNADLVITNPDIPPEEIQRKAGHLTHVLGG